MKTQKCEIVFIHKKTCQGVANIAVQQNHKVQGREDTMRDLVEEVARTDHEGLSIALLTRHIL